MSAFPAQMSAHDPAYAEALKQALKARRHAAYERGALKRLQDRVYAALRGRP